MITGKENFFTTCRVWLKSDSIDWPDTVKKKSYKRKEKSWPMIRTRNARGI